VGVKVIVGAGVSVGVAVPVGAGVKVRVDVGEFVGVPVGVGVARNWMIGDWQLEIKYALNTNAKMNLGKLLGIVFYGLLAIQGRKKYAGTSTVFQSNNLVDWYSRSDILVNEAPGVVRLILVW
jgi:hypothetical protein